MNLILEQETSQPTELVGPDFMNGRGKWAYKFSFRALAFGGVHAVAGVSIEVRRGTLTGLIGPNGAGKSTLLAMLAGTMPVTSGQVIYAGADVTGVPAYRRARRAAGGYGGRALRLSAALGCRPAGTDRRGGQALQRCLRAIERR